MGGRIPAGYVVHHGGVIDIAGRHIEEIRDDRLHAPGHRRPVACHVVHSIFLYCTVSSAKPRLRQ